MPLDRSRIQYLIDDLKSRPDRLRLVQRCGIAAGVVVVLLVVLLLTRGNPPPRPKPKAAADPADSMTQGVKDAFAYAKTVQAIINREPRFSRVYLVPSAATPTQKLGKVVVMGEVAAEEDVQALQAEMAKAGVPVPVEWQVVVPTPR